MRRLAFLFLPLAAAAAAAEDPREIVRRAVETYKYSDARAVHYSFIERQDMRQVDSHGRTKKHEIRTYEVTMPGGSPYRRLIARNDEPLPPEEDRHEEEKREAAIKLRGEETPQQRAGRIADWDKKRRRQREFLDEVPGAFDFRLAGETTRNGRALYVIHAEPRPGYNPGSMAAGFLRKTRAVLWIDKEDYGWARLEAEAFDNVALGLFLVRVHKGTRVLLEQTRVAQGMWLPTRTDVAATLRIALVKWIGGEWRYQYRDYRLVPYQSPVAAAGRRERE